MTKNKGGRPMVPRDRPVKLPEDFFPLLEYIIVSTTDNIGASRREIKTALEAAYSDGRLRGTGRSIDRQELKRKLYWAVEHGIPRPWGMLRLARQVPYHLKWGNPNARADAYYLTDESLAELKSNTDYYNGMIDYGKQLFSASLRRYAPD